MTDFTTPEALAFRDAFNAEYRPLHDTFTAVADQTKYITAFDWSTNADEDFEEFWKWPYENGGGNAISFEIQVDNTGHRFSKKLFTTIVRVCTDILGYGPDSDIEGESTDDFVYWHMENHGIGDNYGYMTKVVQEIESTLSNSFGNRISKQDLLSENAHLRAEIAELRQKVAELEGELFSAKHPGQYADDPGC